MFSIELNSDLHVNRLHFGSNKVLFIDNFLKDPMKMVEAAATSVFEPYPGRDERKGYPGIRAVAPKDYSYRLTTFLEPLLKSEYGVPQQLDIRKSICAFSLLTVKPENLGPLQLTPHFDASTPHHIAVLLYLCGSDHGGTAFYRHNRTGLDHIDADTRESYLDIYYEELNRKRPVQEYFGESNEIFSKIGMLEAKFNRLAIYKGSSIHAPFIASAKSIDANPTTGRLTVNSFFDF